MQKKELHKLRKTDLLTIIYEQQKSIESLKDDIKGLEEELQEKDKQIKEIGTITEASVKINKIFEVAEAADKYLNSLKKVNELENQSEMHYITNEERQSNINENKFNNNLENLKEENVNITNNIVEHSTIENEFRIDNTNIIHEKENTNEKESQTIEKVESQIMLIPANVALATIMPKFTTRVKIAIGLIINIIKTFCVRRASNTRNFIKRCKEKVKVLKAKYKSKRIENRIKKLENRLKKVEKRNVVKAERKARKKAKRLEKAEQKNILIAERNARKEANKQKKAEKRTILIAKHKAIKEANKLKREEKRRALIAKRITRALKKQERRKRLLTGIKTINVKTKNGIKRTFRILIVNNIKRIYETTKKIAYKIKNIRIHKSTSNKIKKQGKISNFADRVKANKNASKKEISLTAMQISLEDIEHELNAIKKKESRFKFTSTFLFASTVVVAVAIITATSFFRILQVNGNSMEPSLQDGELLITSKFFKFKKGDIVAFYYNDKILIKRVIATEGEIVSMDDDGAISVNGTKLNEDYVSELDYGKCDITFPYKVPENSVFIMGDNRRVSLDSRSSSIGCILCDNIIGKINIRVKPFKLF